MPLNNSVHLSQFPGHECGGILVCELFFFFCNLIMFMGLLKGRSTKSLGFVNSELILTADGYLTSTLTLKPGHIVVEAMASPKEDGFPKKRGRRL